MSSVKLVAIDGAKLRRIIEYKGMHLSDVSEKLGYDASMISRGCSRNSLSRACIAGLEGIFGIMFEDFAPSKKEEEKPKPAEEEKAQPAVLAIDYQKMFATIYKAVYDALEARGL